MNVAIDNADNSATFRRLSYASFFLLLALVLTTPFVEMSGFTNTTARVCRLFGYGLLGLTQISLVALRGWRRSLDIFNTPVIPFLIWCAASLTWTQHLDLTAKRLVLLSLIYLGVYSGVFDLGLNRSSKIIQGVLAFTLLTNFVAVLALPNVGVHEVGSVNLWRGVMAHKNIAGMVCTITIIFFTFSYNYTPHPIRYTVIAAALMFSYFAWSKTAWLSLPVAMAAGGALLIAGQRGALYASSARKVLLVGTKVLIGSTILLLVAATLQRDFFLSLTDDTSALTTRAAIWRPMIQFYLDHPLLGSGYGAYWDAMASGLGRRETYAGLGENVDQGHNGYLDLLVQVGLPGLVLALYAAVVRPASQMGSMLHQQSAKISLALALVMFSLVENFSESSLFADDTLGNVFLLFGLAILHSTAIEFARNGDVERLSTERDDLMAAAERRKNRQAQASSE